MASTAHSRALPMLLVKICKQAHGNRHDEDYLIDGLAALQVVGEWEKPTRPAVLNTESTASTSPMMPEMAAANLAGSGWLATAEGPGAHRAVMSSLG